MHRPAELAAPGPAPLTLAGRGRRAFNAISLPGQIGVTGLLASLLAGAGVAWAAAAPAGLLAVATMAGACGATLLGVALARRARAALRELADAAHELRRDDAPPTLDLPLLESTDELRHASVNLRRMLEAARKRERLLEERNAALEGRLATRTHQLSTLQDLSIGLASKADIGELVGEALDALGQTMVYSSASLWARADREAGGQVGLMGYRTGSDGAPPGTEDLVGMRLSRANLQHYEQIERERQPLIENRAQQSLLSWLWSRITDDARSSTLYRGSRSWMAVPLRYRDDVLGVMRVDHQETDYFDPERARLLSAVSSQTALALRHARLQAQERDVAVAAERNRIARDLHDAVSQTLFAAKLLAGNLTRSLTREASEAGAQLAKQSQALETLTGGALAEMRMLMFELRPDALPKTPLHELLQHAVDALSGRGDIAVSATLAPQDSLPPAVRVQLYRMAQEALSNVSRHSGARHCRIEWRVDPAGAGLLLIADDGCGFDAQLERPGHFGVGNMRERAQEIGATLAIASGPDQGTEIRIEWSADKP